MYDQRSAFEPILQEHSSQNQQAQNTQKNTKNQSISQSRFPQYLISPAIDPGDHKLLGVQSPSPFKKSAFSLMEQENLHYQKNGQGVRHNFISNLLNLNESPVTKKKQIQLSTIGRTPKPQSTAGRTPKPQSKQKRKNSKGLRTLSEIVYQIVLELKVTTYKQVANRLVSNLNQSRLNKEDYYRDEQNIKRRVYDALNVLISASVLQKRGKEVMTDNRAIPQKMRIRQSMMQKQYMSKIDIELQQKKFTIGQKRRRLQQLQKRYEVMQSILKRNKKKKFNNKPKINFPFLESSQEQQQKDEFENFQKDNMSINKQKQQFRMKVQKVDDLIGDADLLMKIDLASHNIDQLMQAQVYDEEEEIQQIIQSQKKKHNKN